MIEICDLYNKTLRDNNITTPIVDGVKVSQRMIQQMRYFGIPLRRVNKSAAKTTTSLHHLINQERRMTLLPFQICCSEPNSSSCYVSTYPNSNCFFSTAATKSEPSSIETDSPADDGAPSKPPPNFKYPKAQDLFERITTKLSAEEVHMLSHEINKILGRSFSPNEFYYRRIGVMKSKRKKGGSEGDGAMDGDTAAAAEKASVDLKLVDFDAKAKIKVIKEIRSIVSGLGLKEAKELVESAPTVIQKELKKEQAEEIKVKLEELGATVEIV